MIKFFRHTKRNLMEQNKIDSKLTKLISYELVAFIYVQGIL